jgi:hypothetical protein
LLFDFFDFVGGWLGDGCSVSQEFNSSVLASVGAAFKGPTLWIYGEGDPFYLVAHSRTDFDAFRSAGGRGELLVFDGGHAVANLIWLWERPVKALLSRLGQ